MVVDKQSRLFFSRSLKSFETRGRESNDIILYLIFFLNEKQSKSKSIARFILYCQPLYNYTRVAWSVINFGLSVNDVR